MVERTPILDTLTYGFLMLGICIVCFPIFYTFVAASLPLEDVSQVPMPLMPGDQFWMNTRAAWEQGNLGRQLLNSFVMASGITIGKIVVSILGAFSIVYFDYRFRKVAFATVFCTLMLTGGSSHPAHLRNRCQSLRSFTVADRHPASRQPRSLVGGKRYRHQPGMEPVGQLHRPDPAPGGLSHLHLPFPPVLLTVPEELCEAAKLDGASAMKFFYRILLPLSKTNIAALIVIEFVYGWNQYLWPLLITTNPDMTTAVIGLQNLIPQIDDIPYWNVAMAGALLVMMPPILVVLLMQRWFVRGLVEREK